MLVPSQKAWLYHGANSETRIVSEEKVDKKDDKVPYVAKVDFEEINNDDLSFGTKTRPLKEAYYAPVIYKGETKRCFDAEGNYVVTFEAITYINDITGEDSGWSIFNMHETLLVDIGTTCKTSKNSKYVKTIKTFKVIVAEKAKMPYIQLVCTAKQSKYNGEIYVVGDVVTLCVDHPSLPPGPIPAVVSVQPKVEQTFIPLLPKQKIQIITDRQRTFLEYNSLNALMHLTRNSIPWQRSRWTGMDVVCDLFGCTNEPESQEIIFVNSHDGKSRTVCIPVVENIYGKRYPVIIAPTKSCRLYANNIDGFILRERFHLPISTHKDCPIEMVYAMDGKEYSEIKINLKDVRPYFIIERTATQWFIKAN